MSHSGPGGTAVPGVASIGSTKRGMGAGTASARSGSTPWAGGVAARLGAAPALTSSLVRPVLTLTGWSSASQPSTASGPALAMSSQGSPVASASSPGFGLRVASPVRTIVHRPRSFSPRSRNLSSPSTSAWAGSGVSRSGSQ
ncbi:MAG: hypothetical protein U0838_06705 [Chloroflexota bacterium]